MRIKASDASTIIIGAELLMYGYINIRLDRTEKGTMVTWLAVADGGGDVVDNNEKEYNSVNFDTLLKRIIEIDFPDNENDDESIIWGIQFGNDQGELIDSIGSGTWNRSALLSVISFIEESIGDDEPTVSLNEMLAW